MATRVNNRLLPEIKRYGAFDVSQCFNCGNCTAVCPLSQDNDAFPRRMIRYAQLGLKEHLVSNKELWLCQHCGECSETCPRQAGPAEFMAASRRYAIAQFDPSGLARSLHLSTARIVGIMGVLGAIFAGVLLWRSAGVPSDSTRFSTATMLDFVPFNVLHDVGIGVFALLGVVALLTLGNMLWMMARAPVPGGVGEPDSTPRRFPVGTALKALKLMLSDVLLHRRQRDCSAEEARPAPWPLRRWFLHLTILGGFGGLAAATVLDMLLKDPDAHVMPWSPIRLLGILAGLVFTYGTSAVLILRLRARRRPDAQATASERYYAHTLKSDWLFLWLLWLVSVTGFVLTSAIYLPVGAAWLYGVFLVHVVLAMELLVLMPFTKFAHAIYRPVAIWYQHFRRLRAPIG